jgi:hypothetical protein
LPRFRDNIGTLLGAGHPVALISMPFFSPNPSGSEVSIPNLGGLLISNHDELSYLDGSIIGSPLKYFIQPIVSTVDYFADTGCRVFMTGVSGGGWSTTLAAALDPRIEGSVAVAGSVPLQNLTARTPGDWEQQLPGLLPDFAYPVLYVLGTFPNRVATVAYNNDDLCCFASRGLTPTWQADVTDAVKALGGEFTVVNEPTSEHDVGPQALQRLLELMKE